ncbi:hypothetical protein Acr_25g0003980 [Actinidia rufa]|uniref:S-protein homolog n=1 Tax=Actinidia rufa TaxID=165716 RepID=A0A7J0GYU1_9ERIC|nr:hypothetical protein Acr_25g0003980 [Actinidia rufa]
MLVTLSLFILSEAGGAEESKSRTVHYVRVTNQLGNGIDLQLHCKSRNDDLGIHVLSNQQFFQWHFRNNVWGTTRFYCYLFSKSWNNSFDVYYQGMCGAHCNWFVRQNGTCLETQEPYRSFCYPWPKGEREGLKLKD